MIYLIWSLPAIAVVLALVSGKANALVASAIGVIVALAVALAAGPRRLGIAEAGLFLARGAWIGWIVVPYILGGLLLWQVAMRRGDAAMPVETTINDDHARRRLLFTACYLIGPFAEAATGFGIGIIGTMLLIRRLQCRRYICLL
jgi:lactate permease